MPRQKSGDFDQAKYVNEYHKQNIKQVRVSLNRTNTEDMKLLEWLDEQPEGASGYLKRIARADMESRLTENS